MPELNNKIIATIATEIPTIKYPTFLFFIKHQRNSTIKNLSQHYPGKTTKNQSLINSINKKIKLTIKLITSQNLLLSSGDAGVAKRAGFKRQ